MTWGDISSHAYFALFIHKNENNSLHLIHLIQGKNDNNWVNIHKTFSVVPGTQ